MHRAHPDVPITLAAVDEGLNEHGYIVPAWAMRVIAFLARSDGCASPSCRHALRDGVAARERGLSHRHATQR